MFYFATCEKPDGAVETVNGILDYGVEGDFFYFAGIDFEMYLSSHHYRHIEINEGEL